jgi:CubicO group peptidase (beta-lactamase class C family)
MKKLAAIAIALLLFLGCKKEQKESKSPEASLIEEIVLKQKKLFEVPGIAVGVIKDGETIFANTFGVKKLDTEDKLSTKSLFHMASVSKPFVATAVVQLVEKGKIDLDEKLTTYLPYFTMADERYKDITVRQTLNHTSGIPNVKDYEWDKPEYDDGAAERYVKSHATLQLDFTPGEKYRYSNAAFDILCDLIAKTSGMTFEAYMKKHIFEPVGMVNSTFYKPEVPKELATTPHVFGNDLQKEVSKIYPYNRRHAGSSTLHSNVEDMLLWAKVNLNKGEINGKRIYSEESYKLLTSVQTPEGQRKIGLSWFLGKINESPIIYHSGGDTGYNTFFGFLPEKKAAIAMMVNTDRFGTLNNAAIVLKNTIFQDTINPKAPIIMKLKNYILTDGIEKVKKVYFEEEKKSPQEYTFDNGDLDDLGYWLIDGKYLNEALAIFKFNVELEPKHAGWHDSVADAYREMDSADLAIEWYKKALAIKPDQDFSIKKLNELLAKTEEK